jgi:cyanate permease
MNRDQVASLMNYAFGIFMTFLVSKGVDQHAAHVLVGSLGLVASFGFAWWMNHGVTGDIILSLLRRFFTLALSYLTFRGWITEDLGTSISTAVMSGLPILLSMWGYSPAPGPNLPGTTIFDEVADKVSKP